QTEIQRQRDTAKELAETLKNSQPSVKKADTIQKWVEQRVIWLDRLNELSQTMQGTERHYVTKLVCQRGSPGSLGAIRGNRFAEERDDVESLTARLTGRDG